MIVGRAAPARSDAVTRRAGRTICGVRWCFAVFRDCRGWGGWRRQHLAAAAGAAGVRADSRHSGAASWCRRAPVPPDVLARGPGPPVHTTWLPRSCSSYVMNEATMQKGPDTSGAVVADVLPALQCAALRRIRGVLGGLISVTASGSAVSSRESTKRREGSCESSSRGRPGLWDGT